MTQEEKSILLQDLCARLPYGVEVYYSETVPISTLKTINSEKGTCIVYDHSQWYRHSKFYIETIKPYLRPIHKLTKEELEELEFLTDSDYVDYCNKHHIDYRNLIPKGLALEALEGMYR